MKRRKRGGRGGGGGRRGGGGGGGGRGGSGCTLAWGPVLMEGSLRVVEVSSSLGSLPWLRVESKVRGVEGVWCEAVTNEAAAASTFFTAF